MLQAHLKYLQGAMENIKQFLILDKSIRNQALSMVIYTRVSLLLALLADRRLKYIY